MSPVVVTRLPEFTNQLDACWDIIRPVPSTQNLTILFDNFDNHCFSIQLFLSINKVVPAPNSSPSVDAICKIKQIEESYIRFLKKDSRETFMDVSFLEQAGYLENRSETFLLSRLDDHLPKHNEPRKILILYTDERAHCFGLSYLKIEDFACNHFKIDTFKPQEKEKWIRSINKKIKQWSCEEVRPLTLQCLWLTPSGNAVDII